MKRKYIFIQLKTLNQQILTSFSCFLISFGCSTKKKKHLNLNTNDNNEAKDINDGQL